METDERLFLVDLTLRFPLIFKHPRTRKANTSKEGPTDHNFCDGESRAKISVKFQINQSVLRVSADFKSNPENGKEASQRGILAIRFLNF
jgi:hypothetical protein